MPLSSLYVVYLSTKIYIAYTSGTYMRLHLKLIIFSQWPSG